MEQQASTTKFNLIPAIIFSILALSQLIFSGRFFSLLSLLWIGGEIVLAVSFFMGKRNILPAAGFSLVALAGLLNLIIGFPKGFYLVKIWHAGAGSEVHFSLLCFLPSLAAFAAYAGGVLVMAIAVTGYFPKFEGFVKKFWFLPGALCGGSVLLAMLASLSSSFSGGYWVESSSFIGLGSLFSRLIWTAGLLFAALWAVYPDGLPLAEKEGGVTGNGYCGMVKHLLLLVFTFGVWYMIWIYRTTRYLNQEASEPKQIPGHQVLACLFVPFYQVYWAYKNAQKMDKLCNACGIPSNLTVLCLVLQIFVPFVPSILLQDKINIIAAMGPMAVQTAALAAPAEPVAASAPASAAASVNENPDGLPEL